MNDTDVGGRRILIVDDDHALAEMLSIVLEDHGFGATWCGDGERAVEMFPTVRPDLILLDIMLPGLDGIEVARRVRAVSPVPIIMLTARTETADVVKGLEAGSDDYVVKPFKVEELVARIHARLRTDAPGRRAPGQWDSLPERIESGAMVMDRLSHRAVSNGVDLRLTPMEFELLFTLAAHPGEVMSRSDLLRTVWGYDGSGDSRLVTVHVQRLRSKVEDNPERPTVIVTVRGVGYKFVPPSR